LNACTWCQCNRSFCWFGCYWRFSWFETLAYWFTRKLKVVCHNTLFITIWRPAFLAFFKGYLIKVNKNTDISPSIIALQVLCDCIFIGEVRNTFTNTFVSVRVVMDEECQIDVLRPKLIDFDCDICVFAMDNFDSIFRNWFFRPYLVDDIFFCDTI